jgi:serine/threonine protein kinase
LAKIITQFLQGFAAPFAGLEIHATLRDTLFPVARPSFDVWSLGVILYELCSGRELFSGRCLNNDNISDSSTGQSVLADICNWQGPSDALLSSLFVGDDNKEPDAPTATTTTTAVFSPSSSSSSSAGGSGGGSYHALRLASSDISQSEIQDVRDLLEWMLQEDPEKRPQTLAQVLSHVVLGGIHRHVEVRPGMFLSHVQVIHRI